MSPEPSPQHPLLGRCLCGAVRFEVRAPFASAAYCYCHRCQRRTLLGLDRGEQVERLPPVALAGPNALLHCLRAAGNDLAPLAGNRPDDERPTEFVSKKGSPYSVAVLKKEKK